MRQRYHTYLGSQLQVRCMSVGKMRQRSLAALAGYLAGNPETRYLNDRPFLCHSPKADICSALAPPFRDEFLTQDPTILDGFLREAKSSGSADISDTCIALLSDPLPASIPLPYSAQDFFMQVFERAVQCTNEQNVSNVYTLLNGSCHDLLRILPTEFLDHFEDRSYRFLREKGTTGKELESYRMQILYLGILATLLEPRSSRKSSHSDPSSQTSQSSSSGRSNHNGSMEEIVRVFKGSAAHSTVNWITTMVLRICATGARDFDDAALRSLKIAIEVLTVIPSDVRQSYVEHKESSKFVGKLIEKAMKLTANPVVQLQVSYDCLERSRLILTLR